MPKNSSSTLIKITEVFMDYVADAPLSRRMTVVELTRKIGIDRKTFYHYFDSLDSLVQWIFRNDLCTMLSQDLFAGYKFHKPDPTLQDRYPEWPIGILVEPGDMFLGQQLFYKEIGNYFESKRPYYSKILSGDSYFNLIDYLVFLFVPTLKADIITMLDGKEMPRPVLSFLAEYHVMGIFGRVRYHFANTGKFILQDELDPFFRYGHIMLQKTIESLYTEKELKWYQNILKTNQTCSLYRGEFVEMVDR